MSIATEVVYAAYCKDDKKRETEGKGAECMREETHGAGGERRVSRVAVTWLYT